MNSQIQVGTYQLGVPNALLSVPSRNTWMLSWDFGEWGITVGRPAAMRHTMVSVQIARLIKGKALEKGNVDLYSPDEAIKLVGFFYHLCEMHKKLFP